MYWTISHEKRKYNMYNNHDMLIICCSCTHGTSPMVLTNYHSCSTWSFFFNLHTSARSYRCILSRVMTNYTTSPWVASRPVCDIIHLLVYDKPFVVPLNVFPNLFPSELVLMMAGGFLATFPHFSRLFTFRVFIKSKKSWKSLIRVGAQYWKEKKIQKLQYKHHFYNYRAHHINTDKDHARYLI